MQFIKCLAIAQALAIGVAAVPTSMAADAITGVEISDLTYSNAPTGTEGFTQEVLDSVHFYDSNTTASYDWNFDIERYLVTTTSFNQPSANKYGKMAGFSVQAVIPTIVQDGSSGQYEWSSEQISQSAPTATIQVLYATSTSGVLTPTTGVDCQGTCYSGAGTYSYTSTVTITRSSGATNSYAEAGTLSLNTVSTPYLTCSPDDSP